jgi:hypothetical protein
LLISNCKLENIIEERQCLALLDPSQRNWFCKSQLVTIIAIGLRNPYAKSETGAGLDLSDVY